MLKRSLPLWILLIVLTSCAAVATETVEQVPMAKDKLTFIDFYSDECPNCMIMQPIVDKLADRYRDQIALQVLNVDTDGKNLFESMGLHSNPVFLIVMSWSPGATEIDDGVFPTNFPSTSMSAPGGST